MGTKKFRWWLYPTLYVLVVLHFVGLTSVTELVLSVVVLFMLEQQRRDFVRLNDIENWAEDLTDRVDKLDWIEED